MADELVTVLAGGRRWTAFRRVMVERSFKAGALTFRIDVAAEASPAEAAEVFHKGAPVDIYFNSDLACRGFVDRYQPRLTEHNEASIAVAGRSKSQDLIDGSAVHPTGYFDKMTPLQIGQALDKAGVGITSDLPLDKIAYTLTPGETVYRCLEKMCRQQDGWPSGQPDGSIKLTRAGSGRNGPLIQGRNIKSCEADHNWSGRHSQVIVRGQRPYGHGADNLEIEAVAQDAEVGRHRPVVIIQDGDTDKGRAKKLAKRHRDAEAGNSLKATVTTQGFRDDAGTLWTPGYLSFTESPFLNIAQDMAIAGAVYQQDRKTGSLSTLSLVDPRALAAQGRKGGKAGSEWSSDAGEPARDSAGDDLG